MKILALLALLAFALAVPAGAGAATSFKFGTGEFPDIAMDPDGVAHVVWDVSSGNASAPEDLHYCQLAPGATACKGEVVLHPPFQAIGRSTYVFAPAKFRVVIVSARCCSGVEEPVWAYESTDGGKNFAPGHVIGNIDPEQNAVFGPGDSVTGSNRTDVQTMPLSGAAATTHATLDAGFPVPTTGSVAVSGTELVHTAADGSHSSFNRLVGADPNDAGSWSAPTSLGAADETRLAGGPKGIVTLQTVGTPGKRHLVTRKFSGATAGPNKGVSETGDPIQAALGADPQTGNFVAAWIDNRQPNELRFSTSQDGVAWASPQVLLRGDEPDSSFHLRVSAGGNGKGFVVYDGNGNNTALRAAPLQPLTSGGGGSGGGGGTVNGGSGETTVDTAVVGDQQLKFYAPLRCVKPGTVIRLRVTHKQKLKLSPKRRVKIVYVVFSVDKKKKKDKKAAFKAKFKTKGFKRGSRHKVKANILLKPVKGHGKNKRKVLKGSFKICP
jgi:hypothetical protein